MISTSTRLLPLLLLASCSRVAVELPDLVMPAPLRQRLLGVGRDIAQVGPGHPWAGRYEAELGGEQLVAWLGPRAGLEWFLVERGEVRAHGGWQSVEEAEDAGGLLRLWEVQGEVPDRWKLAVGERLVAGGIERRRVLLEHEHRVELMGALAARDGERCAPFLVEVGAPAWDSSSHLLPVQLEGALADVAGLLPVRALVAGTSDAGEVMVTAGLEQGLHTGLELQPLVPALAGRTGAGRVVEAEEGRAVVRFAEEVDVGELDGCLLGRTFDDRFQLHAPWFLEPEVEQRIAQIEHELERLGTEHPWAGHYSFGDGLHATGTLYLAPEAGYSIVEGGDLAIDHQLSGSVSVEGEELMLDSYRIIKVSFPPDHSQVRSQERLMAEFYGAWGRPGPEELGSTITQVDPAKPR